ncbi:uncharacterized protein LOC132197917 isoform X2 [Neocloeon triangulifer]|uniref:uncharacterized protein LOC132197917 isoform X2 n=1 Tax=Neocloeon triangulifer TaxID=2078957 RepID=UPI00286F0982|nr:uncharacterized protein LOC132197917 isoform X2 [Neocloeon triangulifer]
MDWKKSIFILLYLPAIIQGVVHFIKNDIMNKNGICYTDSEYNNGPTMVFLRNVKKGCPKPTDETFIANGLINDCNLVSANGCGNWTTYHFELKTNLVDGDWFDEFEPVLDHRWNSFKEIVTCGGGDFTNWTRMRTNKSQGRFHYSVLTYQSAYISLSKHENLKIQPGFQIVLDGWGNHHMSCIRYCTNLLNSKTCTILAEKVNENIFNGGNAWATVTVEYEMDPLKSPTTLKKLSVSVMNKNWKLECSGNNSHEIFNFVAFKTHEDVGYFRIHKYNYIEKGQNQTTFTSEIKQEQTAAAISLTYYVKNKTSDTIYVHTSSDRNPWQPTKLPTNAEGKWQTATILLVNLTIKKASLFFQLREFEKICIGHISLLSSETFGHGFMISSREKNLLSCSNLDQINTILTNKTSEKIEKLVLKSGKDRETICQKLGSDNCSNIEACDTTGCFCISGFKRQNRKCIEKCRDKEYGPNCDLLSEVNCPGDHLNVHTGKCGLCELHGFQPPDCAKPCRDRSYGPDCAFQLPQNRSCNGDYNKTTGVCLSGCEFSGQQPPYCDRDCDDGKFGANCTQDQPFGKCKGSGSYGNYNKGNGNCIDGCARAFQPPQCSKECDDGAFGINCEERCQKGCSGPGDYGEYNKTTGQCLKGCKFIGKQPPLYCYDGKFGKNCKQEQPSGKCRGDGYFGSYNKLNGNCIDGCSKAGLKPPQCIDECEYGDFGSNCEEKRLKYSCSGSGEYGEYNKSTGQCLNGCKQNGKRPPNCNTSCTNGTFGPNCSKQLKSGKCSGQGKYGDYDSATGNCKWDCARVGFEFPSCEHECRNGKYGQNCKIQLKQNVCAGQDPYGDYSKSNGDCKSCKFKGKKPSKCEHDCDEGYFGEDCKQKQSEKCSGNYHRDTGNCKKSCAKSGLKFPECEKPCDQGRYGLNCSGVMKTGKCAGPMPYGAYNKETGNCTQGCAKPGFYPPACVSHCINGSFGLNCSKKLGERKCVGNFKFGNYNPYTGVCNGDCLYHGVEHPECEKDCQNGSYGKHCLSKLSPNSCAEQSVGNYDKKTGDCKKCAQLGYKLPKCTDPCEEGKFGQDCQRTLTKLNKCSGGGNYGNYSRDSGNCSVSCKDPGFEFPWCEKECENGTYGHHCNKTLSKVKKCSGHGKFGNYIRESGNCKISCNEPGFEFPWCEKECEEGKFGQDCRQNLTKLKKCSGAGNFGNYSRDSGNCNFSCAEPGFQYPWCENECEEGTFGQHCQQKLKEGKCSGDGNFGNYSRDSGNCSVSCQEPGLEFPWCEKECDGGKFGNHCEEQLNEKKCSGGGKYGNYSKVNGQCRETCEKPGLQFPDCEEECRDGKIGINCNEEPGEVQGRCSGEGEFGGYEKATGYCKQGCRFIGMQPPMCTSECKKGQYGLNCKEKLDPSNCKDELYNVTNAHCLKGCAREGLIVPNCQEGAIEENNGIIYYFLIGILVIVILFLIIVLRKKFLLYKLLSRNLESEPEYAIPLEVMVKSKITMNEQTSLKNFGNTVTIEEYADYFATELQSENLCEQFRASPRGQIMPINIGSSEENKKKNRDGVIPAYDETRVCLQTKIIEGKKTAKNGYINANHVRVLGNKYVATQGPLEQTVKDFWRMVWQEKATMIVMLANLTENGEVKCAKYWPEIFEVVTIGSLEIRNIDEIVSLDFFKRTLSVTNGSINRKITQMHYTVWPDHGIPFNAQSTAIFVENVLKISMDVPMIVHCSSGEGRTGAYIMIDACLRMAKSQGHLNPCGAFKEMRRQRANLVETEPQYIFAHFVLYEALCIPKLAIPCKKFKVELGKLLQNGHKLLKTQLHQLNEICAKDWSRMEIRDSDRIPEKCRKPELQALPLRYVRLVPEDVFCCQNTFINAVYVDGYKRKNAFIATQVPLSDTVSDFWLMVYQQRVKSVIVLNEAEPNEPIFLPCNVSSPLTGVGFSVGLQSKAVKNNYQTLTVDIKKGYDNWVVEVVCFVGWPAEFLTVPKLGKLVKLCEDEEFNLHDAPTVLICHDGVMACGAIVALSIILEKIKMEHDVDVASAVRAVRSVRPDFVSKLEQFEMLYRCALEYILSFATYRNLD